MAYMVTPGARLEMVNGKLYETLGALTEDQESALVDADHVVRRHVERAELARHDGAKLVLAVRDDARRSAVALVERRLAREPAPLGALVALEAANQLSALARKHAAHD